MSAAYGMSPNMLCGHADNNNNGRKLKDITNNNFASSGQTITNNNQVRLFSPCILISLAFEGVQQPTLGIPAREAGTKRVGCIQDQLQRRAQSALSRDTHLAQSVCSISVVSYQGQHAIRF